MSGRVPIPNDFKLPLLKTRRKFKIRLFSLFIYHDSLPYSASVHQNYLHKAYLAEQKGIHDQFVFGLEYCGMRFGLQYRYIPLGSTLTKIHCNINSLIPDDIIWPHQWIPMLIERVWLRFGFYTAGPLNFRHKIVKLLNSLFINNFTR